MRRPVLLLLAACASESTPPEEVAVRRLNRTEYDNTVRDLLLTTSSPAARFLSDDRAFGFDNAVEAQRLAPIQVELYADAAQALAEEATSPWPSTFVAGETLDADVGARHRDLGWRFTSGTLAISAPHGRHRWAIRALALETEQLSIRIGDSIRIETVSSPQILEGTIEGGTLELSLIDPGEGAVIDWVRFDGPLAESSRPLFTCEPSRDCAEEILGRLAYRGYRRPLREGELDRLMALFDASLQAGDPFEASVGLAIQSILLSPSFLFRSERTGRAGDYELASRLSYFLWSSMPDDALLARARAGELTRDDVLQSELARMLESPKAAAFIESFTGQWLFGRAAGEGELEDRLRQEQRRFFAHLIQHDRPLEELLTADYTFADAGLARHYGLPETKEEFHRVELSPPRRGVLGQGAVHAATSLANRTSPTKRGKWVMGQLLCAEPPPPPPDVPALVETSSIEASPRQQLEEHRSRPECAGCHAVMDPIGFALEIFDRTGRIRTEDRGHPIDPSGELPDGTRFEGPHELAQILARREDFRRCVARQLLTYALGRGPRESDPIDRLAESSGFRTLIEALVMSDAFRGEP